MNRSLIAIGATLAFAQLSTADVTYNWQYRWVKAQAGSQSSGEIYAPDFGPWEKDVTKQGELGNKGYGYQKSSLNPDGIELHGIVTAKGGNLQTSASGYTFFNVEFTIDEQMPVRLEGLWNLSVGSQFCGYEATIDLNSSDNGQLFLWSHNSQKNQYESGKFPFEYNAVLEPGSYQLHAYMVGGAGTSAGGCSLKLDALLTAPAPATAAGFVMLAACGRRRRGARPTEASA